MTECITVKQPWASLIVEGIKIEDNIIFKDIENRTWRTSFRGRVLIHAAAKSWTWQKFIQYLYNVIPSIYKVFPETRLWLEALPTGKIIGSVEIVDCVINHPSIWAEKTPLDKQLEDKCIWNWGLANPIKFDTPIPCKGKLSFWEFDETLIK